MTDEQMEKLLNEALTLKNTEDELKVRRPKKSRTIRRTITGLAAAAACGAIILTGIGSAQKPNTGSVAGSTTAETAIASADREAADGTEGEGVLDKLEDSFTVTVYAAEADQPSSQFDGLCLYNSGLGDGSYSGLYFKIEGENIAHVDLSLTKGELYTAVKEDTTRQEAEERMQDSLAAGEDFYDENGAYCVLGISVDSDKAQIYHCTRLNQKANLDYDPDILYGFYIPDDAWNHDIEDLSKQWWTALQSFDGSQMDITVTFEDGTTQEKSYSLRAAHVSIENGTITEDENGGYRCILAEEAN